MFIPKKKLGKIHRKNKQLNNGFQNHYSLSNENQSKYHHSHFIFNNYTQFRNYGNMLLTYKKNSDLTNECKILKSNILELNETIKKKDLIISNLKKRINSMSSNSESNRSKSQSENYDNEKNNEGDKINEFNDGNTLSEIRKNINPLKGYFQNSNNFSLTFRNSSIKSKISQQNSYVKNIPFTLTYFRYKEKISKKKKDLKTNLYNEFKNEDSNSKKKDTKKNSKNTSLSTQKLDKTKNLLQDINNKTKKIYKKEKKEKKEKKKNSPINKNLLSHRNLKSCSLNTKITKEKEEKKKVSTNKNKNKTNIKKRNMKIGMSYKELQKMKISHYKKNIPKKEIKVNEKNINDNKDNKKMKKSFNNNNKEEKNNHLLNLRKNSVNENEIKFVDIDDNNSNNDVEKIFENIEEQNLKDLKNKLKSGIKSFSNSKNNKNEKNKNEDFHQIDYNKNINDLKTNEIEYKRLNEQEIKNKGLITIKNKFSLLGNNKEKDYSSSSSNSFKLFDKQNDDYLNKIGFLDKEDNFHEFFFERSIIDDDSYSYSKEK